MARSISIYRRRPNLVDLFVRQRPDIGSFQFKAGTNFDDAAPALFETVPSRGMKSISVPDDTGLVDSQFKGMTRFRFNPADYTVAVPAVNDSKNMFIKIAPVTTAGVVGPDEAYHMILPFAPVGPQRSIVIHGVAPNVAALANSLELQLPMLCNNFEFQVDTGNNLCVAFDPAGAEWIVYPVAGNFVNFAKVYPNISQIFVRGDAATSTFTAIFTERNNPIL
jgi:hypothetical protein